jgi:hypothetical protein
MDVEREMLQELVQELELAEVQVAEMDEERD